MNLTENQIGLLAKYFSDISKLLIASTVIGFFVPFAGNPVDVKTFILGFFIAIVLLSFSVKIIK